MTGTPAQAWEPQLAACVALEHQIAAAECARAALTEQIRTLRRDLRAARRAYVDARVAQAEAERALGQEP